MRDTSSAGRPEWFAATAWHAQPSLARAIWQLANTLIPYILLWYLMVRSIHAGYSYWITLALAVPTAGLMVRVFIFFHDCVHNSFFASKRANTLLGHVLGVLTFTPFTAWQRSHVIHHATAGNLDRRGIGDVWTMTVEEYLSAPPRTRLWYRFYRNPLVTFILGPIYMFLIVNRFAGKSAGKPERYSVYFTNLALAVLIVSLSLAIGLRTYLLIQLPVTLIAGSAGVWLFYVQHQYEDVCWTRHDQWDPVRSALEGSSYYRLPRVLQWFTGNIGLHHIHHLRPRIPNYNLQACYDQIKELQEVKPLTLLSSLRSLRCNLWDEKQQKMVSFSSLRT